jgi:hypothetical protein
VFTKAATGGYSEPRPHTPFVYDELYTIYANLEHIETALVSRRLTVDKQVERSTYHTHPVCGQIETFTVGLVNRPETWDVYRAPVFEYSRFCSPVKRRRCKRLGLFTLTSFRVAARLCLAAESKGSTRLLSKTVIRTKIRPRLIISGRRTLVFRLLIQ